MWAKDGGARREDDEGEVGGLDGALEMSGLEGEGRRGLGRTADSEKMSRRSVERNRRRRSADVCARGTGDSEQLAEEESAAADRVRADNFRDVAEWETAAGGVVNRREACGEGSPGGPAWRRVSTRRANA